MLRNKGVAIIECTQEIPCNPCVAACKTGAITKASLNACPRIDPRKCVGCKLCVAACSGQAIFLQALDPDRNIAKITFPYEYYPLPCQGQTVKAVNRLGAYVCDGVVAAVESNRIYNKTTLVTVEIPLQYADEVRFMQKLQGEMQP